MKVQTTLIRDVVEIVNAKGETIKTWPYTFNVSTGFKRVQELRAEMMKQNQAKDLEAVGRAVFELMAAVFGDDNAADMVKFYENDYMTMLNDLAPVLLDEIYPAVDRYVDNMLQLRKRTKA